MAVSDAFCVLDNLLTAHVLAADVVTAVQPEAEVTINTSSSSVYEHDRMLLDLLAAARGRRRSERRRPLRGRAPGGPRRRLPAAPRRGGGHAPVLRRHVALRRGARAGPGAGLGPAARPHAAPGPAARGRRGAGVAAGPRPRRGRLRLVRPGGQPRHPRPGPPHGRPAGATGPSGAPCGTSSRTRRGCGPGAPPRRPCARACPCGWSKRRRHSFVLLRIFAPKSDLFLDRD